MTKLAMILGLCAFLAAPAFADETATPAANTETAAAPAKKMKGKKKRGAKKAKGDMAAPAADAPKAE